MLPKLGAQNSVRYLGPDGLQIIQAKKTHFQNQQIVAIDNDGMCYAINTFVEWRDEHSKVYDQIQKESKSIISRPPGIQI